MEILSPEKISNYRNRLINKSRNTFVFAREVAIIFKINYYKLKH